MSNKKNRPTAVQLREGSAANTTRKDLGAQKKAPGSAPAPTVADPALAPASEPEGAPEIQPEIQKEAEPEVVQKKGSIIRLDIFLATQFRPDQAAGFAYWARKQNLKPRTMGEWREQYAIFAARPV